MSHFKEVETVASIKADEHFVAVVFEHFRESTRRVRSTSAISNIFSLPRSSSVSNILSSLVMISGWSTRTLRLMVTLYDGQENGNGCSAIEFALAVEPAFVLADYRIQRR